MKRIVISALSAIALALPAYARPYNNPQANALLQTLQDTQSMTKAGISYVDFQPVARNIQIKLDRFLRSPGAANYPGGDLLRNAAQAYVHSSSMRLYGEWSPKALWSASDFHLYFYVMVCEKLPDKCSTIAKSKGSR